MIAATETHWDSGGGTSAPDRYELEISGGAIQVALDDDVPHARSGPPALEVGSMRGPLEGAVSTRPTAPPGSRSFALELMQDGVERAISHHRAAG